MIRSKLSPGFIVKPIVRALHDINIEGRQLYDCIAPPCSPINVSLRAGVYKFDLWGASGYSLPGNFSQGSHVSGFVFFNSNTNIYLYLGEMGIHSGTSTFNGGGSGSLNAGYSGGGASDIRLIYHEDFSNFRSLLSRIIVSGGGGGHVMHGEYSDNKIIYFGNKSCGGDITGGRGLIKKQFETPNVIVASEGGQQDRGGMCHESEVNCSQNPTVRGSFGVGGSPDHSWAGGGGGGYFGGSAGYGLSQIIGSGAGGSSFVSGCNGCIAISRNSTPENITPLETSVHYSRLFFTNIEIHSGLDQFLGPNGEVETGHFGNGAILITPISFYNEKSCVSLYWTFLHFGILIFCPAIFST